MEHEGLHRAGQLFFQSLSQVPLQVFHEALEEIDALALLPENFFRPGEGGRSTGKVADPNGEGGIYPFVRVEA
ncbi:MAG: hypothetical protein ACPLSY_01220 [Moorellaceae bacterium]